MNNIKIVQSAWISRKVQKIAEKTGADWLELINQETEKLQNK